jgi:hypothetical protein
MIPIVRIYATQQQARDAARALAENGFPDDAVHLLTSTAEGEPAAADASAAALVAGYALGSYPRVFTSEHVKASARALAEGRSLVGVRAGFGQGQTAMNILDGFDPVDTHLVMPESESAKLDWDEAAPLSSALGIPTISPNSPAPLSDFLGLPPLSSGLSFLSRWFRPLSRPDFSLSSMFGMPLLSMKTLSGDKGYGTHSFGLPLLSRNPAPLSSMLGLKTLSRRRPGERKRSFGLPLLTNDD